MVNLICLQQLYKRREIAEIKQINVGSNPIDAIIKSKPYQALKDLININIIKLQVTEWVKKEENRKVGIESENVKLVAKALVASKLIAIFHPRDKKL